VSIASRLAGTGSVLIRTGQKFTADRCPLLAAAIAYQVLFSIIPVTALLVAAAGPTLRTPGVEQQVVDVVTRSIPLERGLVMDAVRAVSRSSGALSLVGGVLLLWVASGMFSTLREALNAAWSATSRGIVRQTLADFAAVAFLALLVLLSIAGTGVLHSMLALDRLPGPHSAWVEWAWRSGASAGPALVSLAAFLLVYRYVPNVRHGFREVLPGAVIGAILFEAAKHGFAYYVSTYSRHELLYGALGTVMLFQLWIYVSATILLAGAELNAVLAAPPPETEPPAGPYPPASRG
jgi:membrane protein